MALAAYTVGWSLIAMFRRSARDWQVLLISLFCISLGWVDCLMHLGH